MAMYKYALRMLAGANPREVIESMPEKDYRRLSEFMSKANQHSATTAAPHDEPRVC